jgi:hypothetical protein
MTSGGFPVITTSNGYTKAQVDTQFSNLIDSAPAALNTLKELANALANDANYATTVQNQLATKANTTYVNEQLALKQDTVDWLSENEINERHQIDTGLNGLFIKAGNESSILVYGTSASEPGSMTVYKNMNVQGNIVAPNGTIEADIIKTNHIEPSGEAQVSIDTNLVVTGNVTINGSLINYNPFWVAGKVAASGATLKTQGKHMFTVSKTGTGQYTITFAVTHPSANNIVTLTAHGYTYLSSSTATNFGVVLKNYDLVLADQPFHFTVLA